MTCALQDPYIAGSPAHVDRLSRAKILRLESEMLAMPQVDVPITHEFADGVCARTMHMPAGSTIVGKLHKTRHIFFVMQGLVSIYTEFGERRVVAPAMIVSEPGEKRVIYAHTDVVWTNIHATHETDPAKIEEEVIAPSYEALEIALLGRA